MKKRIFYTEVAYFVGLVLLALGTALLTWGDFGISMVVAPAYILHLKVSQYLPFFSFGMAEYVLQAAILVLMMLILRKAKVAYFLSFATAVLYGFLLDGAMALTALLPEGGWMERIGIYVVGVLLCTSALALLLRTYLPLEAYEMFVKEVGAKIGWSFNRFKTVYDCASCVLAAGMSLLFFGRLEGLGIGTVVCALIYGVLIGGFSKLFDRIWCFEDRFSGRKYFEGV